MNIFESIERDTIQARDSIRNQAQKNLTGRDPIDDDEPQGFRTAGIMFGDVPPSRKTSEYLQSSVGWVYACVSAIADSIAQIRLELFETKKGEIVKVEEHAILDLLNRVNRFQTEYDHRWLSQQYLELTGEAPWFIDRGDSGEQEPQNILLLRPDALKIKKAQQGSDDPIAGYEYREDPKNILQIKPTELIFLKYPDPVNPFRGKGTLAAAAATVDVDTFSEDYNKRFFYNSARPDSILQTDQKLTAKQREELRVSLKKLYGGRQNAHKTAILESGLEWKPMALTQKDMDFLEQQRFSMAKILSIFRVPKPIVAISDDVNLANAKIAEYVFSKWTVRPKMIRIVAQLNEFLLPMFKGTENMFLSFQDPVPQDTELALKRYDSGLGKGYMTINEVRNEVGLDEVGPEGDIIYLPFNLVPIEAAGQPVQQGFRGIKTGGKKNAKYNLKEIIINSGGGYNSSVRRANAIKKVQQAKEAEVKKIEGIEKSIDNLAHALVRKAAATQWKNTEETNAEKLEEEREKKNQQFADIFLKSADTYERTFEKDMTQEFERQKKSVLESAPEKAVDLDDWLLDEADESKILVRTFTPLITKIVKEQGDRAGLLVGMGDDFFDMATRRVQEYLKKRVYRFSFETTKETNRMIGETLKDGVSKGEGIPELRKRVEGLFDDMEKYRSERIARSEVIRSSNFATVESYKQSNVVKGMEWLVTNDDRLCPWCEPLDGKKVKLDESFFDKGDTHVGEDGTDLNLDYETINHPPLHPNCRCTIIPII